MIDNPESQVQALFQKPNIQKACCMVTVRNLEHKELAKKLMEEVAIAIQGGQEPYPARDALIDSKYPLFKKIKSRSKAKPTETEKHEKVPKSSDKVHNLARLKHRTQMFLRCVGIVNTQCLKPVGKHPVFAGPNDTDSIRGTGKRASTQ